jgi:hypothetical protein
LFSLQLFVSSDISTLFSFLILSLPTVLVFS